MKVTIAKYCWLLTGILFVVSALFKAMNVYGFQMSIISHFDLLSIAFPYWVCLYIALLVIVVELLLGLLLLNCICKNTVYFATVGLMLFFTILTCWEAFFKPDMDCGCFGKVYELSAMQSFVENIAIDAVIIAAYPFCKAKTQCFNKKIGASCCITIVILLISMCFSQPIYDFGMYGKGKSVKEALMLYSSLDDEVIDFENKHIRAGVLNPAKILSDNDLNCIMAEFRRDKCDVVLVPTLDRMDRKMVNDSCRFVLMDTAVLSQLISSNVGLIDIENLRIKYKWEMPLHLIGFNVSYFWCGIWKIIFELNIVCIVILTILLVISQSGCRKTLTE